MFNCCFEALKISRLGTEKSVNILSQSELDIPILSLRFSIFTIVSYWVLPFLTFHIPANLFKDIPNCITFCITS